MEDLSDLLKSKDCEKSKAKGEKQGKIYYNDAPTDKIISEAVDES